MKIIKNDSIKTHIFYLGEEKKSPKTDEKVSQVSSAPIIAERMRARKSKVKRWMRVW